MSLNQEHFLTSTARSMRYRLLLLRMLLGAFRGLELVLCEKDAQCRLSVMRLVRRTAVSHTAKTCFTDGRCETCRDVECQTKDAYLYHICISITNHRLAYIPRRGSKGASRSTERNPRGQARRFARRVVRAHVDRVSAAAAALFTPGIRHEHTHAAQHHRRDLLSRIPPRHRRLRARERLRREHQERVRM
jgi:hypothetical protein